MKKQNIYDLRGQQEENNIQDSVILRKNHFDVMIKTVRDSIESGSFEELQIQVRLLVESCDSRKTLIEGMKQWIEEQDFLDFITQLKDEDLKPSSSEIIDYEEEVVQKDYNPSEMKDDSFEKEITPIKVQFWDEERKQLSKNPPDRDPEMDDNTFK